MTYVKPTLSQIKERRKPDNSRRGGGGQKEQQKYLFPMLLMAARRKKYLVEALRRVTRNWRFNPLYTSTKELSPCPWKVTSAGFMATVPHQEFVVTIQTSTHRRQSHTKSLWSPSTHTHRTVPHQEFVVTIQTSTHTHRPANP